jgi:tRNA-Thr(GGU) m(6)t(6)A37 methyltransferase TsaA
MNDDAADSPSIRFHPIGVVRHEAASVPRHWSVSDVEGDLVIDPVYRRGLCSIAPGDRLVVLFHFHRSGPFTPDLLVQRPPHRQTDMGVFSICSPRRPNPIGLSVVEVLAVADHILRVRGLDMFDGTPIVDLKPFVTGAAECPSTERPD